MSSKTETNEETTQTHVPTFVAPQYVAGTQPFLYVPQFEPLNVGINHFETQPFVSSEGENASGCKRWGGCQRWRACCWKDDGRALGTFQNFVVTLLLGTASPFLSILLMYGMETSKLSRNGVLFGTANALLLGSAFLLSQSKQPSPSHEPIPAPSQFDTVHPTPYFNQSQMEHQEPHVPMWAVITLFVVGLVMLIAALRSFRRFLYIYGTRQNKAQEETVKVISQKGACGEFFITFFISFIFPFLGTFISIIARRRYLYGRYGALSGFGFTFVVMGVAFAILGCCAAPGPLFVGLIIMELSMVHFRRALICAETPQTVA